jgi:hypothetical protein
LRVYEEEKLLQTLTVSFPPSATALLPRSEDSPQGKVVVAEASRLSVWDVASGELLQTSEMNIERILALEIEPRKPDMVLVAGDTRSVTCVHLPRFTRMGAWRGALKSEVCWKRSCD